MPKSFLAVNLSENHTFHKKEEAIKVEGQVVETATIAEMKGEQQQQQQPEAIAADPQTPLGASKSEERNDGKTHDIADNGGSAVVEGATTSVETIRPITASETPLISTPEAIPSNPTHDGGAVAEIEKETS